MDTQSINDQLELLRLKELIMSNIDIRSKMAMLICEEDSSHKESLHTGHSENVCRTIVNGCFSYSGRNSRRARKIRKDETIILFYYDTI